MFVIYYFSGTGNSLHVAKEIQKLFPEAELIPIVRVIRSKSFNITADKIGIVFPCHGLTIPTIVKDFLIKADFGATRYIFAAATRGGSIFRGFSNIDKILRKKNKILNASFIITMSLNDPKLSVFSVPTKEELISVENSVQQKLSLIKSTVFNNKNYQDNSDGVTFSSNRLLNFILERLIPFMVHYISQRVKKYFYSDANCTSCGTCAIVCPSQKIIIKNGKPFWQPKIACYTCYACLNYCPSEAIQIYSKFWMKSYTQEKGRYPHPYAVVKDISQQKE